MQHTEMQHTEMQQTDVEGFRPSTQQVRLWQNIVPAANILLRAELYEAIVPARLRQALEWATSRHEILRTHLQTVPGMQLPVQVIDEHPTIDWYEVDAMPLSAHEAETQEAALVTEMHTNLGQAGKPVLCAALIQHAPQRFRLLLAAPLVNADTGTMQRLLQELAHDYRQSFASDSDCVQYADFAEWQHAFLASAESDAGRAFWRRQIYPALMKVKHPFERRTAAPGIFAPACQLRHTSARWTDRLFTAAAGMHATPAALVSVCWSALLQRQLGLSTVMLGWRHDGRNDATHTAFGPYAKTLPLLLQQNEESTLKALAQAQDALLAEAQMCHESLSAAELAPSANTTNLPYVFEYRAAADGDTLWKIADIEVAVEPCALWLTVVEPNHDDNEITLALRYDASRFTAQAAEILLDQLAMLVEQACTQTDVSLQSISGLSEEQGARLAVLNRTGVGVAASDLLHMLFEELAARQPDAIAVEFGMQQLSYGELNRRANQLAHRLRREGIAAESPVGLYVGRSLEAVIGVMGILKAGGAYLPLDPTYPAERLAFMLEQTAAPLVLTVTGQAGKLPQSKAGTLLLDDENTYAGCNVDNPAPVNRPDSLAYMIFTSGSTGQPKGVMVSHRNAVHSTMARWHLYGLKCESFLLSSSFAFDSSVAGLFWTLSQGGKLCLPGDEAVQDVEAVARLIEAHQASHVLMLSSFYSQLLETQPAARLASLKCVIVAGEACMATVVARHRAVCPQARFYNEYGPTEGSVWCTLYKTKKEDAEHNGALPIGQAIANMRVHVLDQQMAPMPYGIAGEIFIGGTGIVRGYLQRPDLTAERFIPDPFGASGERLYRTGDIGRFDADGNLDFLGRVDHQVKIRGFRIELGEIEARLAEHPAIREAAVVARADHNGETRLIAYVVAHDVIPAIALLQQHLKQHLPDYMVPAAFMVLDALPLTPNGKLDRAALPEPEQGSRRAYTAPRNESELLLAEIWADVLGTGPVGLDDDFFELGGHSLVAAKLVSRLRSVMGREVSVRSVFQHTRLADFVRHVQEQSSEAALPPIVPVPRDEPLQALPVSFSQQRMWQFDRQHPHSIVYNVPSAVRLLGKLDMDAMQRSFDELMRRHEALRTTFHYNEDAAAPVQIIAPVEPVALQFVSVADLGAAEREAQVLRLLSAEEHTPFDLARGPLLRAGLICESEHEHVLWITLHHIVSDRWSMQVLVRELSALYEAYSQRKPSPLPEPAIQYADFAVWQRQYVQGDVLQRQLDFWKAQLRADQPPLQLPGMRPRPAQQSHRGDKYGFDIDRELAERIHGLCRRNGATLFMTMLAAFKTLLAIRSGQPDVPVGILLANRNRLELEGLTGCLINMLALRADIEHDNTFAAYLERVRDTVLAAQANQDVPFECVVDAVQPQSSPGCSPLFQVLFDVHRDRILQRPAMGGLTFADAPEPPSPTTHFDLMVGIGEREDGLRASFVYCTDLFDEALIASLARDYIRVLDIVAVAPDTTIAQLAAQVAPLTMEKTM